MDKLFVGLQLVNYKFGVAQALWEIHRKINYILKVLKLLELMEICKLFNEKKDKIISFIFYKNSIFTGGKDYVVNILGTKDL